LIQNITDSSVLQNDSILALQNSVSQIEKSIQTNATYSQSLEDESITMNDRSKQLQSMMSFFK
jgi:methyl-accepting chemotaxis protein